MGWYDPPEDNLEAETCDNCGSTYYSEIYVDVDGKILGCSDCLKFVEGEESDAYVDIKTGVVVADAENVEVYTWYDFAIDMANDRKASWEDAQFESYRDRMFEGKYGY